MTDQSPIHGAKSPTALNLSKMNVLPGGKQPLMDDGFYFKDGVKVLSMKMSAFYSSKEPFFWSQPGKKRLR